MRRKLDCKALTRPDQVKVVLLDGEMRPTGNPSR